MPGDEKAILLVIVSVFVFCTICFIGLGLFKITQGQMSKKDIQEWAFVCLIMCLSTSVLYVGFEKFF